MEKFRIVVCVSRDKVYYFSRITDPISGQWAICFQARPESATLFGSFEDAWHVLVEIPFVRISLANGIRIESITA